MLVVLAATKWTSKWKLQKKIEEVFSVVDGFRKFNSFLNFKYFISLFCFVRAIL